MRRALSAVALLPRNVCVVVLRAYRAVVSPLYGEVCRYHPSCSRYALEAIQQYGVVVGSSMGAWRIARCNPWAAGGIDDVRARTAPYPVTRFGFVLPRPAGDTRALGTRRLDGTPVLETRPVDGTHRSAPQAAPTSRRRRLTPHPRKA
ncbi:MULTISPECIES: membrane protein insertion efficiency factor YidD [unclassified Curtobacterium]|uniref:membrane protein insertion efficiency factor YidD n=1 Tax=unclassified Curtobacterium TaxID=257496 RepID=UPI000DA7C76D|nr:MULTISPECIES: membrane protein insertion efficiency factor YidD [unclassified Curtobacterium]PZE77804.1 membrane protein insertion efficiency factor YidD [Curtobacterium sp. MCBD17_019]WIB63606.1 membrane protein insertion efficiency factor YidD [Curtobacterium sp. MCBD17_040]WIE54622.1 membrane protein insertion efficiency factor YidD [Curtobacterium sp. MCBD17_003]